MVILRYLVFSFFTQKPPTVLSPVQREITKTSLPLHSFVFELGLGRPVPSPSGVPAPSPPGTPRSCAASRATGSMGLHLSRGLLAVNGGLLLPPICTAVPCPWSAAALSPGGQGRCVAAPPPGVQGSRALMPMRIHLRCRSSKRACSTSIRAGLQASIGLPLGRCCAGAALKLIHLRHRSSKTACSGAPPSKLACRLQRLPAGMPVYGMEDVTV